MSRNTFINACINGDVLIEEIDDYIDQWHEGDFDEELYEFLGMTQVEYRLWVENDSLLKYIIKGRIENRNIEDVMYNEYYGVTKLAARAKSPDEAKFVYEWLKRRGKLEE